MRRFLKSMPKYLNKNNCGRDQNNQNNQNYKTSNKNSRLKAQKYSLECSKKIGLECPRKKNCPEKKGTILEPVFA